MEDEETIPSSPFSSVSVIPNVALALATSFFLYSAACLTDPSRRTSIFRRTERWCRWCWRSILATTTRRRNAADGEETNKSNIFQKCSNPDCIRCRRYAAVNAKAERRLPWVLKDVIHSNSNSTNGKDATIREQPNFDRVINGIRNRRALSRLTRKSSNNENNDTRPPFLPPYQQYPTVLLVPGLRTQTPLVTHWHQSVCRKLEGHCGVIWNEYYQCQQQQNYRTGAGTANEITPGGVIWRVNDISSSKANNINNNRILSSSSPSWKVLHLLNQGKWQEAAVQSCPQTVAVLKRELERELLDDGCIFGNAFFSVLTPGTFIAPHCGPSNVRHRIQLPLQVAVTTTAQSPPPRTPPIATKEASMTLAGSSSTATGTADKDFSTAAAVVAAGKLVVAGQEVHWEQGKAFAFDDSLVHSAIYDPPTNDDSSGINNDDKDNDISPAAACDAGTRVVLVVDVWHPDLSAAERLLIARLYAAE